MMQPRRIAWSAVATVLAVVVGIWGPATTAGAASDPAGPVTLDAAVDGNPVDGASANRPVSIGPGDELSMSAEITNDGTVPVTVERIRLDASALGVTFLAYDTVVPVEVAPGTTRRVAFDLPVDGVEDQATGLLPASISVYDATGQRIAQQSFTADVRGRPLSLFGLFGLVLVVFTLATLGVNLWLLATRRLPPRRFMRGVRFGVTGAALGLSCSFLLAALRIVPPYATVWPIMVALPTIAAFLLGVVSPGPLALDEDEIDVALRQYRESLALTGA